MQKQVVNGVMEKFNIFDIFSMLIPGCITMSAIYISVYPLKLSVLDDMGPLAYITVIVISYVLGLVLHEIGRIFDEKIFYNILYNGDLRNTYSLRENKEKIFKIGFIELYVDKIKEYLKEKTKLPYETLDDRTVFHLCSTTLEMSGIKKTADKFIVISEMSRSLYISLFLVGVIDLILMIHCDKLRLFFAVIAIIYFIFSRIFYIRKNRYEVFRLRNLLRTFYIRYCTEIDM